MAEDTFAIDAEVGRRVQALRKARGLQQQDLAEAIGVTQSRVSAKEGGRAPFSIEELVGVAKRLGVAPGVLLPGGRRAAGARG